MKTPAEIYAARRPIYQRLLTMPPFVHWSDRGKPFDARNSRVLHLITALGVSFTEAQRIFNSAHKAGVRRKNGTRRAAVLVFDRKTRLWRGREYAAAPHTVNQFCGASRARVRDGGQNQGLATHRKLYEDTTT